MRFIITEYAAGGELFDNEQILPFGTTTVQALSAFNTRVLECLENFDKDGTKRWLTVSIAPDNDPIILPNKGE